MVFAALEACRPFQSSGLCHFTVHRLVSTSKSSNHKLKEIRPSKKNQTDGVGRLIIGSLSKPRRRRQRERHQTKGLMSNTVPVNVRYNSLYISMAFSA